MSGETIKAEYASNGWPAMPRSHTRALKDIDKNNQAELDLDSVKIPNTSIAAKVFEYAQESMPEKTFNHSMRVWNYGERRTALFAIFSRHLSEEQR